MAPSTGGATTGQWIATIGVVGGCSLEIGLASTTFEENPIEAVRGLYDCAKAISDNQDAIVAVAGDMWATMSNVFDGNGSPSDPQLQETTTDQIIGMANDMMPGGYGHSSEVCTFQDPTGNGQYSDATTFDVTNYSGDWGDQQVFQAISGTDSGFSFQGDFQQAYFSGSTMTPQNGSAGMSGHGPATAISPGIGQSHPFGIETPPTLGILGCHSIF